MPASPHSLHLTEVYRARMLALRARVESATQTAWGRLDPADLDGSYAAFSASLKRSIERAQREAVRASNAYLSAFISSELGHLVRTPIIDSSPYVGVSWDGQALPTALLSPLIGVKTAIKDGKPVAQALALGRARALRGVGLDTDHAARQSLTDAMARDPRVAGWRRAVKGTCDACLGLAQEALSPPGTPLEIHPGCQCVSEAVVKNVPDRFPRPSGEQIFAAMAPERQDANFGPEKAQALRDGTITLADCVDRSHLATAPAFLTAKPLADIPATGNPNQ